MTVHKALLVRIFYILLRVRIWFNNHCNLGDWIYNMHVQSYNTLVLYSIEISKHFIFNPVFFFIFLQVAWVRVDTQTILSIHHNVITQNPRITLSYNDHRSWYLHIRDVHEEDRGWYMCQVNTDPMRSRQGYLQVVGKYKNYFLPYSIMYCVLIR